MICNRCLSGLGIPTVEREDFRRNSDDVFDHEADDILDDRFVDFTDSDLWLSSDDR
jgi:hypothetical protein